MKMECDSAKKRERDAERKYGTLFFVKKFPMIGNERKKEFMNLWTAKMAIRKIRCKKSNGSRNTDKINQIFCLILCAPRQMNAFFSQPMT